METGKFTLSDKTTILKTATDALELLVKYRSAIEPRLKPDEIGLFQSQVEELSGKKEPYKREKTRTREETSVELQACVECIRKLVKNNEAPDEILKAYGADETTPDLMPEITAAGRKIIRAYGLYAGWSRNEAGILLEDMDEINQMIKELSGEEDTTFIKSTDENQLSQEIVKEITRISALGVLVFKKKDPAVAIIFEKLIPSGSELKMEEAEITG